jgi:succinoglycan biosynthesis protein ExoA
VSTVSIIIPTLREVDDIADCLATVAAQDYPSALVSVIVVDGSSDDGTADAARRALAATGVSGTVVDNPARLTANSLNIGLAHASGDIIVRLDARSRVQPHYVRTCVDILATRPNVAVVGGAQIALPLHDSALHLGIARALRNRWATGLSRYRRSTLSGPADTVWMGAFRARDLRSVGGWDDRVALNEDYELNERFRSTGSLVWFEAGLRSGYRPRSSLRLLSRQYFGYGTVKGKWWARGRHPNARQAILLTAPLATGAVLFAYGDRRGWARASGLVLVAVAGVEVGGSQGPAAGPLGHAAAGAAILCIGSSWWLGAICGYLRERAGYRLGPGAHDGGGDCARPGDGLGG